MQYKSKYYDPKKAHEYYMRTRELKGYEDRYGGSRGDGTSAASTPGYKSKYQREVAANNSRVDRLLEQNSNRYSSELESLSESRQSENSNYGDRISDVKNDISEQREKTRDQIDSINDEIKTLRESMKNMSLEERKAKRDDIKAQIKEMRDRIKNLRKQQSDYAFEMREQIRDIREEQRNSRKKDSEKKKALREKQRDEAQRLRQMKRGGSTSGFNEKGKAAAAYIKKQMEKERNELTKKINAKTDAKMLDRVTSFVKDIERRRASGEHIGTKEFMGKTKILLGEVRKTKVSTARKYKKTYQTKYKREIDKLRSDDSMFSYWDKRNESIAKAAEKRKAEREKESLRRQQRRDERIRRRDEHYSKYNKKKK